MLSGLVFSLILSVAPQEEPYPRVRLAPLLPPMTAHPDWDAPRAFAQRGGEDSLSVTPPQIEMTAGEDMSRAYVSLAFNWIWLTDERGRRPVWFARLRAVTATHSTEQFADSRRCPAVEATLARIRTLPLITPRVPDLPPTSGGVETPDFAWLMHDNGYRIRMRGMFAGAAYSDGLVVSGGSTSPIAPVVVQSLEQLKDCWSEAPPPRA